MSANAVTKRNTWPVLLGYAIAILSVLIAWLLHEHRLIIAGEGLGYGLGVAGASMMLLLLLYPLRKRLRLMRTAGPIRHWFRAHMMLGVVGPILVLLHSNFSLGSINSQVALFCTIVVASSGLLGRYFYAGIHNGLYGQRTSFDAIRTEIEGARSGDSVLGSIKPIINERLQPLEDAVNATPPGLRHSLQLAIVTGFKVLRLRRSLRRLLRNEIVSLSESSVVVASNRKRLLVSTFRYLNYRLSVLLKFAQLHACERLLSLWHVVHYPLFMVLVVAAIVHVIAVHMY